MVASACSGMRKPCCAAKTNRSLRSFRFCTPARLRKACGVAMRRPSGWCRRHWTWSPANRPRLWDPMTWLCNWPGARQVSEALDLVTRKQAAFMGPDDLALQLAAYEALAGNRSALSRLREVEGRLTSGTVAPVDRIRQGLFAGIVEAHYGSKISAEEHLRCALAAQEKEMSRQPDLSVEIYVRLVELLRASGREAEAAEAAR